MKAIKLFLLLGFSVLLSSCGGILSPFGFIAGEQKTLIITAFSVMLIVVIPVLVLTVVLAFKYRAGNNKNTYTPEWSHNVKLELFWWLIPIIIIVFLSILTWVTSHSLDPYKKLDSDKEAIRIQVISLNWKWLFIYPDYGIATINYIEVPVGTPIDFSLASDAPMNSFWIPQIAGQIYTMKGMTTQLHILVDKEGKYKGVSSNYSGVGFEGMKFTLVGTSQDEFDNWVDSVKGSSKILDQDAYDSLVLDSINNPVELYVLGDNQIFKKAIKKYMNMPNNNHGKIIHNSTFGVKNSSN